MINRLFLTLAACLLLKVSSHALEPYTAYLAPGIDLGISVDRLKMAYPQLLEIVKEKPGRHGVVGMQHPASEPVNRMMFHLFNQEVVAISFMGSVPATLPNRAALLTSLRTDFLRGFKKESTVKYEQRTKEAANISVESWSSGGRKAYVVESEDFAQVVVYLPERAVLSELLPFVGAPGVSRVDE